MNRRGFLAGLLASAAIPANVVAADAIVGLMPRYDNTFEAYVSRFRWEARDVVADWRYVVRMVNVDEAASA